MVAAPKSANDGHPRENRHFENSEDRTEAHDSFV